MYWLLHGHNSSTVELHATSPLRNSEEQEADLKKTVHQL